ncbi:hypothetical protein BSKO_07423 [Bryopsis sp. KO-2023]|nr:hypothetical protein BSKO_07423 [Bryopsis sp. KO-2023]
MGCGGSKPDVNEEQPRPKQGAPAPAAQPAAPPKSRTWKRMLPQETPDISSQYELGKVLGRGQFGTTRVAVEKSSKKKFAAKSISKRKMSHPDDIEDVKREIEILHHLNGHDNIVMFKGAFEDRHNIHLVMELCTGGELFDRIVQRGQYSEKDAAEVVRTMLKVVAHCHDMGVIHRDLKPENFLLADPSSHATLKAIDFGLSVFFKEGHYLRQIVGSAYYVAPEVLRKHYSKEADIWSCGVILYILLSGVPPFYGETEHQIFDAILQGPLDLESEPWPYISAAAKDAVKRMLVHDPKARAGADEILSHEWMRENGVASNKPLGNAVVSRLKGFAAMNKLKKTALMWMATNLPREEIEGLKQMFMAIDTDRSGTITVDELKKGLMKKGSSVPDGEMHRIMEDIDVDGNGVIDYEEFLAATMNVNKLENEEQLVKAFEHFDTDNSGYITRDELMEALQKYGDVDDNIDKVLADVDKDGDGRIDYQEFRQMMVGQ